MTKMNPKLKLVFLHCIIYQAKSAVFTVPKINLLVDVVAKIVNLIGTGALNHRQSVALMRCMR